MSYSSNTDIPIKKEGSKFLLKHRPTKLNCITSRTFNDHTGHVGLEINGIMEVVPLENREGGISSHYGEIWNVLTN